MIRSLAIITLLACLQFPAHTQTSSSTTDKKQAENQVAATVARMARVGSAFAPSFSPDGKWISFSSNISGMPQAWIVPTEGGYPRMVTNGDDPVQQLEWSPTADLLAVTLAPGGGMNTQVYLVRPDGTGLRLLTNGGKDNNGIDSWMEDGSKLAIDSSRLNPAARDNFLVDVASGAVTLVSKNPGVGGIDSFSRDGRRALIGRVRSRGDSNLYLLDVASGKETLLTPHEGVALFFGALSPDGSAAYLVSNKDRDLLAFCRIHIAQDGSPGPVETLAERSDGELDGFVINKQGTLAALTWNVKGRSEFSFYDLVRGKESRGPKLPGEIAGGLAFAMPLCSRATPTTRCISQRRVT